jgi:hypothetical protein
VNFIIIYSIEAHPSGVVSPYSDDEWTGRFSTDAAGNPVGQPVTYAERLALARQTVVESGIRVPVLVDQIDNPLWCTYGPAPNNAYLIGKDGKVVFKQQWYDPEQMAAALDGHLDG